MTDRKKDRLVKICGYLPQELSAVLMQIEAERVSKLCEIRFRADRPVVLHFTDGRYFATRTGRLTCFYSDSLICYSQKEIENVFISLCRCSVHSMTDNIAQGFITTPDGCRVGLYGTAVTDGDRITSVRSVSGLNIRLSGDFCGIAAPIAALYGKKNPNILICGPPSSGKTTMLKDLCRILSDERNLKVCIADERGETRGSYTGLNTDVLDGYPKAAGIETAVRTLSPDVIAFDEIGTFAEAQAVCAGLNSGVSFIMTIHCADLAELVRRPQFSLLCGCGAVDYCVFLGGVGKIDKIVSVKELFDENGSSCGAWRGLRSDGTVHSFFSEPPRTVAGENSAYAVCGPDTAQLPFHTVG